MLRLILLVTLFFTSQIFTSQIWAAPHIALVDANTPKVNLGLAGTYYIDNTSSLTFQHISSESFASHFLAMDQEFLQFGLIKGDIWLKIDIASQLKQPDFVYLTVKAPRLQVLDIYFPQLNAHQPYAQLGESRPYKNRTILHPDYVVALPSSYHTVTRVYLKLSSHLPINVEAFAMDSSSFSKHNLIDFSLTGLLFGIITILFVSNIFFFFKTKHIMYATYGILLLGIVPLHLSLHGFLYQLFPDFTGIQERIYNFSALFCTAAITLFSRYYLDTKLYFPKLDRWLILLSAINFIFGLLFALSPDKLNILHLSALAVFTLLSLTALALTAFIYKVPYARYYLLARTSLFIGHSLWILTVYGILASPFLYQWGLTMSILLEAMIHFTGMIARLIPFNKASSSNKSLPNPELFDLLHDISGRLHRQINILDGYLMHFRHQIMDRKSQDLNDLAFLANNNIKHLAKKLDFLKVPQDSPSKDHKTTILLAQLIDNAMEEFNAIDQDNADIDIITENIANVELLKNAPLIKQLIVNLAQECKHLNEQSLTINISKVEHQRYGITTLDILCFPLSSRTQLETQGFNLGLGYIKELVQRLEGNITIQGEQTKSELVVSLPIDIHIQTLPYEVLHTSPSQLLIVGGETVCYNRILPLLQTWPNNVIQAKTINDLIADLPSKIDPDIVAVLIMFENEGYIPNLALRQLRSYLRLGDQCLLISENVKIPRSYALTLGFDDLFSDNDIEHKLKPHIERLALKGLRIKNASLPQITTPA